LVNVFAEAERGKRSKIANSPKMSPVVKMFVVVSRPSFVVLKIRTLAKIARDLFARLISEGREQ
jgi:hypothetical protein